jgi:hypothetical protein
MSEEAKEKLGQAIDRVDNLASALEIPMPANFHVESLKTLLPETVKELKEAYAEVTGENPWN